MKSDPPCFGSEELFYQLGLRQFGNFPKLKLEPPAPLRPLIKLAIDADPNTELSSLSKPQIVDVRTSHSHSFSTLLGSSSHRISFYINSPSHTS